MFQERHNNKIVHNTDNLKKDNLKRIQSSAQRQRKTHAVKKQKLEELTEINPGIAVSLKVRGRKGRPRVGVEQTDMLKLCSNYFDSL